MKTNNKYIIIVLLMVLSILIINNVLAIEYEDPMNPIAPVEIEAEKEVMIETRDPMNPIAPIEIELEKEVMIVTKEIKDKEIIKKYETLNNKLNLKKGFITKGDINLIIKAVYEGDNKDLLFAEKTLKEKVTKKELVNLSNKLIKDIKFKDYVEVVKTEIVNKLKNDKVELKKFVKVEEINEFLLKIED